MTWCLRFAGANNKAADGESATAMCATKPNVRKPWSIFFNNGWKPPNKRSLAWTSRTTASGGCKLTCELNWYSQAANLCNCACSVSASRCWLHGYTPRPIAYCLCFQRSPAASLNWRWLAANSTRQNAENNRPATSLFANSGGRLGMAG